MPLAQWHYMAGNDEMLDESVSYNFVSTHIFKVSVRDKAIKVCYINNTCFYTSSTKNG